MNITSRKSFSCYFDITAPGYMSIITLNLTQKYYHTELFWLGYMNNTASGYLNINKLNLTVI